MKPRVKQDFTEPERAIHEQDKRVRAEIKRKSAYLHDQQLANVTGAMWEVQVNGQTVELTPSVSEAERVFNDSGTGARLYKKIGGKKLSVRSK